MNENFQPPVPNGRVELVGAFGRPIVLVSDSRLIPVAFPEPINGIEHAYVHAGIADAFRATFEDVISKNLWKFLHSFDGAWNYRNIRGATRLSLHAFGVAFDLNASYNAMSLFKKNHDDLILHPYVFAEAHPLVQCLQSHGWHWGGDFNGRKDDMHFQYATGC